MSGSPLSPDSLRRVQDTLQRRVVARDPGNILAVGFAPASSSKQEASTALSDPRIVAQFTVAKKRKRVAAEKKIQPVEAVRLLNRDTRSYQELHLGTDVVETGEILPTGVGISTTDEQASTALVARWTTVQPVPPRPTRQRADDPRWRWGVMTVSHLFVGRGSRSAKTRARVRRVAVCGDGPDLVKGRVVRRGRIPGGPDIALVETGWDRLWLSGFLPEVELPPLLIPSESDLTRWASRGASGSFIGDQVTHRWTWQAFYPALSIPTLGQLQHMVSYRAKATSGQEATRQPFGPGSSGGIVIADGVVLGMQLAAMGPEFDIGYAQTLDVSFAWLKKQLRATALELVHVVG